MIAVFVAFIGLFNQLTLLYLICIVIFGICSLPLVPLVLESATRQITDVPIYFCNIVFTFSGHLTVVILGFISSLLFEYTKYGEILSVVIITYMYLFSLFFIRDS